MIGQRVVKLVLDLVDDITGAVLNVGCDSLEIALAGNTDMARLDSESQHAIVTCAVDIAGLLKRGERCFDPAAAAGIGVIAVPVIIRERGIHFFHKSGRVAGAASVVAHLIDVRLNIDTALNDLALSLLLNISAGQEGNTS